MLLAFLLAAAPAFDGTWVLRQDGHNLVILTLATDGPAIRGSLTRPRGLTVNERGRVTGFGSGHATYAVESAAARNGGLEFTVDGDRLLMERTADGRAILRVEGMPPWTLERLPAGARVELAKALRKPAYAAEIEQLRSRLAAMVKEDQDARLARDVERMTAAGGKNLAEVERIFARHGWVTNSLAGEDAAGNFWLLVQHQDVSVQIRMLPALDKAVKAGDASPRHYAYLYDRVQLHGNQPQRWGTQIRCKDGKPTLYPVDDMAGLEERRRKLGLQPVSEYLAVPHLVESCALAARKGH